MQVRNKHEPNGDSYGEIGSRDNDYPGDDQEQPMIPSKSSALHPFVCNNTTNEMQFKVKKTKYL